MRNKYVLRGAIRLTTLAGILITATFCAFAQHKGTAKSTESVLKIDYQNAAAGLGPGQVVRIVPKLTENDAASKVLLFSIQDLGYSLVPGKKDKNPITSIAPGRWYSTDIVRVGSPVIMQHNQANPDLNPLPTDHQYGRQLEFEFAIKDKQFVITTKVTLFENGADGPYRKYDDDYSGLFFNSQVMKAISREMDKCYPPTKTPS